MSNKLYTTTNSTLELTLTQYNVDQAVREEQVEQTKWNNRKDQVKRLILDTKSDLVHLQEMRALDGNESPEQWLSSFGYPWRSIVAYRNPSQYSFGQATLYDSSKLFPVQVLQKWLSDTPDAPSDNWTDAKGNSGFGSVVLMTKFIPVVKTGGLSSERLVENVKPFWSVNVHFPLDEEVKTKCCLKLIELLDNYCQDSPVVLSGDFNFFPDLQGGTHLAIMERNLSNASSKLITTSGRSITGTFVGYPHDAFCAKDSTQPTSQLDYIFTRNISHLGDVIVSTKTMLETEPEELTEAYKLPSDHLPLTIKFTL